MKKNFLTVLFFFSPLAFGISESIPSVKIVSAPKMPSVSGVQPPSMGTSFYSPKMDDFYAGATIRNSKNDSEIPGLTTKENEKTGSTSSLSLLEQLNNPINYIKNDYLSAQDITGLENNGNFSNLSKLLTSKNAGNVTLASYKDLSKSEISDSTNNALLETILSELNSLKKQQNFSLSKDTSVDSGFTKDEAKILRFNVNGYNILSTCKKIYFSDKESDGTFLLTGDRQYTSDKRLRNETFYLLFKAVGNESGITEYKVAADVNQDWENNLSFLYQLSKIGKKDNLCASRTGNLITLKIKNPNWNCDLLIDAGSK